MWSNRPLDKLINILFRAFCHDEICTDTSTKLLNNHICEAYSLVLETSYQIVLKKDKDNGGINNPKLPYQIKQIQDEKKIKKYVIELSQGLEK